MLAASDARNTAAGEISSGCSQPTRKGTVAARTLWSWIGYLLARLRDAFAQAFFISGQRRVHEPGNHRVDRYRRYRNWHCRCVHWRLAAASNWYPSRYRNCFGNRQRHHWRRFASACGSAFTRWWPFWRLGQTRRTSSLVRGAARTFAQRKLPSGPGSIAYPPCNAARCTRLSRR